MKHTSPVVKRALTKVRPTAHLHLEIEHPSVVKLHEQIERGTLGFGFPTALGVKAGNPDKAVVAITRGGLTAMQIMGLPLDKWGTKSLQTSKIISEILV